MKAFVTVGCALSAAAALAAPHVDQDAVTLTQDGSRVATIAYTLRDEPAVVTMEIQTNTLDNAEGDWVTVPELCDFRGDVNKCIEPGPRAITWNPVEEWPGKAIRHGKVRALVTAWPTNNPPDVVLVDLPTGDVRFFRSLEALPGGPGNDAYKVNGLVMKRCHAAGVPFCMGSTSVEEGRPAASTGYHTEESRMGTLSADYYLALYEFTVGQYAALTSQAAQPVTAANCLPKSSTTWNQLRGNGSGDNDWPAKGHAVSASSVMGLLRARVGEMLEFDLPTSAQWEFACRAGSQLPYINGARYKDPAQPSDPSMPRYKCGKNASWNNTNADGAAHPVGTVTETVNPINAWGFSDMLGNLSEFVLDHMTNYPANHDFENGPAVGQNDHTYIKTNHRMMRGGNFAMAPTDARSARVCGWSADNAAGDYPVRSGFRVCMPAVIR